MENFENFKKPEYSLGEEDFEKMETQTSEEMSKGLDRKIENL